MHNYSSYDSILRIYYFIHMFSIKIKSFLYGSLITASLISVTTYALTWPDGVFGDYFERMIQPAWCWLASAITGFSGASSAYGQQECMTFIDIVKSVIPTQAPSSGKAVVWYQINGSPIYGEVNWNNSGSDISYTNGNVGIGTDSPSTKLSVSWSILANDLCLLNGSCLSTAAQKTDISGAPVLYNLYNNAAWSNMDTQVIRDQWRWYQNMGCDSYWAISWWSAATIATCKASTDADVDAVIAYSYQPAILRAIGYVKQGGAPNNWLQWGCLSAPNIVLCTQWFACGTYDTYQATVPAFLSVTCIGTP